LTVLPTGAKSTVFYRFCGIGKRTPPRQRSRKKEAAFAKREEEGRKGEKSIPVNRKKGGNLHLLRGQREEEKEEELSANCEAKRERGPNLGGAVCAKFLS